MLSAIHTLYLYVYCTMLYVHTFFIKFNYVSYSTVLNILLEKSASMYYKFTYDTIVVDDMVRLKMYQWFKNILHLVTENYLKNINTGYDWSFLMPTSFLKIEFIMALSLIIKICTWHSILRLLAQDLYIHTVESLLNFNITKSVTFIVCRHIISRVRVCDLFFNGWIKK
jgi:hypothetical protein